MSCQPSESSTMESLSQSSDPSSEQLTTFSQFPALPTELRLKIWHLSIPPWRKLEVKLKIKSTFTRYPIVLGWFIARAKIGSTEVNPIPAILHVNREAREVGLTSYELASGSRDRVGPAYIDFERDLVKLTTGSPESLPMILAGFQGAGEEKIRNLEFSVFDLNAFEWGYISFFSGLRALRLNIWEKHIDLDELSSMRDKVRASARRYPEWKVPEIWVSFRSTKSSHRLEL
ncbi:hypothetical protein OCU04_007857 [Sclerotinia nivalis]|uniref:2EXR domain-containing protein n=1 Tax=Sclerotinia nivalis TaxID=352851 RepID=A0A9X0AKJ5_9HELO|nr:hypothetical protein OCU04_007857 [Sclerotinia nivalis]